MNNKFTIMNK